MARTSLFPLCQYALAVLLAVKNAASFSSCPLVKPSESRISRATKLYGDLDRRSFFGSVGAAGFASVSFPLVAVPPANALGGGVNKINDRLTE
jgi:hypothetical protein